MVKVKTFRLPDEILEIAESWLGKYISMDYPKITMSDIVRLSLHEFFEKYEPDSSNLPFLKFHNILSKDQLKSLENEVIEEMKKEGKIHPEEWDDKLL